MLETYLNLETMQEKLIFAGTLDEDKKEILLKALRDKNPREYRRLAGKLNAIEQEKSLFNNTGITTVELKNIKVNPYQPRKNFNREKLDVLKESIKSNGLISPILLSRVSDNEYIIIAGERRFRAMNLLNQEEGRAFAKIDAKVIDNADDSQMQTIALLENIQRENLTLKEEAETFLEFNKKYTIEELVKITGYSKSKIGRLLKIARLDDEIKQELENEGVNSVTLADYLTTLEDKEKQFEAIKLYKENKTVSYIKESLSDDFVSDDTSTTKTDSEDKALEPNKFDSSDEDVREEQEVLYTVSDLKESVNSFKENVNKLDVSDLEKLLATKKELEKQLDEIGKICLMVSVGVI